MYLVQLVGMLTHISIHIHSHDSDEVCKRQIEFECFK